MGQLNATGDASRVGTCWVLSQQREWPVAGREEKSKIHSQLINCCTLPASKAFPPNMRDTDRLIGGAGAHDSDPEPGDAAAKSVGTGWGKVRELKRQGSAAAAFAAVLDSPRKLLEQPKAHSFVNYEPEEWLPTLRAAVSGASRFVLTPVCCLTLLTFLLTLLAMANVPANERDKFAKHAPGWAQLPPFAHSVLRSFDHWVVALRAFRLRMEAQRCEDRVSSPQLSSAGHSPSSWCAPLTHRQLSTQAAR